MLKARIDRLEQRARMRAAVRPGIDEDDATQPAKLAKFTAHLSIVFYRTWRHEGLSLEQLLALARDDARRELGAPWPARAVRELEIRILLRDGKIDEQEASGLRANAEQHYFPFANLERASLTALPGAIQFDEADALRTARVQCPRVELQSLERQLAMLEEDRAHELQERSHRAKDGRTDSSMDTFADKMHEFRVRELRQKIHDRDARAGTSTTMTEA